MRQHAWPAVASLPGLDRLCGRIRERTQQQAQVSCGLISRVLGAPEGPSLGISSWSREKHIGECEIQIAGLSCCHFLWPPVVVLTMFGGK